MVIDNTIVEEIVFMCRVHKTEPTKIGGTNWYSSFECSFLCHLLPGGKKNSENRYHRI